MVDALQNEAQTQLAAGNIQRAAWRAAYIRMLSTENAWVDGNLTSLADAIRPGPLRDWTNIVEVGRAVDYLLLTGNPPWNRNELADMLHTVDGDLQLQLAQGDLVMAADRLALHRILSGSLVPGS